MRFPRLLFPLLSVALALAAPLQALENPTVKWSFQAGGALRGDAAIGERSLYVGSADGFLYALDKTDGSLHWKTETGGPISGGVGLSETAVFAASRDNTLYALDRSNGQILWKRQMGSVLPAIWAGWDYFTATPVVANDTVYLGWGDGILYALNIKTGEPRWTFKTKGRIRATALLSDGVLYQPSNDGNLYALDAKTGELRWTFATDGADLDSSQFGFDRKSIFDSPERVGDLIVLGARDGHTYGIDPATGSERWRFTYGSTWAMSSAVDDKNAYIGWSTNDLTCAIDLETGTEKWKHQLGAHTYSTPLVTPDSLYIACADGKLYRLNKDTGETIWDYTVGCELYSSPRYSDGMIYLGGDDGRYLALDSRPAARKAVYEPLELPSNLAFNLVAPSITPYLVEHGFERLGSEAELAAFIEEETSSSRQSVLVLAFDAMPKTLMGDAPSSGPLRRYLEAGNKVLSFGSILNLHSFDETGAYQRSEAGAEALLGVEFPNPTESGTYASKATQTGLNWGLPQSLRTMNATLDPEGVTPLAIDEHDRVSAWLRPFVDRPGSGFVSCRTWSYNLEPTQADLQIILKLALHELQ